MKKYIYLFFILILSHSSLAVDIVYPAGSTLELLNSFKITPTGVFTKVGFFDGRNINSYTNSVITGEEGTNNSPFTVISGGRKNYINEYSWFSSIDGGSNNQINSFNPFSVIGGGEYNIISSGFDFSPYPDLGEPALGHNIISGGSGNTMSSSGGGGIVGDYNTISGGRWNYLRGGNFFAFIGGGHANWIYDGTYHGAILGGVSNQISAGADSASVIGGELNVSGGDYSISGGRKSKALHQGSLVFSDSSDSAFKTSSVANELSFYYTNGVKLITGTSIWTFTESGLTFNGNSVYP